MSKSEQTRERLVETALQLFRERGYHSTTMRAIATTAGVSQGNAYYYFDGKDSFVQELYLRIQKEHRSAADPLLVEGAPLVQNLRSVLATGLSVMAPYHSFGATLLHVALSTSSSTSPFSAESTAARQQALDLMDRAVSMSRGTPGGRLGKQLPHLLWLAYLGVTLHWVTDSTPDQQRSRELAHAVTPVIGRALSLARLPVGRRLTQDVTDLVDRFT